MIRLRIDGQECDLYEDFTLPEKVVQLDVERLGELNAIRQGHSIEVEIPSTIRNDELMGYPTDTKSVGCAFKLPWVLPLPAEPQRPLPQRLPGCC